jgi:multiple sugar transport system permease protein
MAGTTALSPAQPGGRLRRMLTAQGRWALPLSPALLLLLVFFAGPILWCLYSAFTNASLTGTGAAATEFVGLANFSRLFSDPELWHGVWLTILFVFGSAVLGQNLLGLGLAVLMQGSGRVVRAAVGGVVVGAWVLPEVVAGFIWYAFLHEEGTLNVVLTGVGLPDQNWLYTTPILAVILANIWRGTAFSMLVYSAALRDVPPDLVEAAEVDGASGVRRFWHVTLPLIRRQILTNLMLITLQTLSVFTLVFVMTGGGPGTKSQTLPLLMYQQAFKFSDLSYGMAIALVLLLVGALFSVLYMRAAREEV